MRVFLDASVLFAASYSDAGASREIIRLALRGKVKLVTSQLVLEETRRNLQTKAPEVIPDLEHLLKAVGFEIVQPTKREIKFAMKYIAAKDAPILAAAKKAKVDFLVSLDKKHIVNIPEVSKKSRLKIVLPKDFLKLR